MAGLAFSHPPDLTGARQDERGLIREKRDALKEEVNQRRDALKQEVQEKRDVLKGGFQQKRQEVKEGVNATQQEMREKRAAFHQEVKEKRETVRTELKEKRDKFREEVRVRKDELKKKLGEKRAERIEAFFQKMVEKFEAAIERLKKHADRIAEHLEKAEANGKSVAEVRVKLSTANNKILEAEKALEDAKAKYTEAAKEPDFRVAFAKVREVIQGVVAKIKEAHRALVDVINSIKGLGRKVEGKEEETKERTVEITPGGFAPATLKIKAGTQVNFVNRDSALHWPASGVHPAHELCPGFDSLKGLAKDEVYKFTFTEVKTCSMHDHLNPDIKGLIIVE